MRVLSMEAGTLPIISKFYSRLNKNNLKYNFYRFVSIFRIEFNYPIASTYPKFCFGEFVEIPLYISEIYVL